ncbi:MAG: tail fiber protein [Alistipes sp.]
MKSTLGNYLTQSNKDFPVDAETFDYIQRNQAMLAVLGNIAGDKAILLGCEPEQNNTSRREGYVFIRTKEFPEGEILYWEGGSVAAGMYLKKEPVQVTAQGYEFPQAYTIRSLAPGIGEENYSWADMKSVLTLPELERRNMAQQEQLSGFALPPLGIVQIWAGTKVPENYELCDGRELKTSDYPELYAAIGTRFNRSYDCNGKQYSTTSGYFRLPDLRGRFLVGYNVSDADYNTYGKVGGEKTHRLTESEIPAHTHGQNLWAGASDDWKSGGHHSWPNATTFHDRTTPFGKTDSTGGGNAHENRPPYYALAYIMRLK